MQRPDDCLVHLRTTESVKIRALFETLNPILVEGSVEFNQKGMTVKGVNMIILCDLIVRADDVEDYVCTEDQHVSINFNTLYTCLCSVGQDEAICFQVTRESADATVPYMSVFIINNTKDDEYVFAFQVTLLALTKENFEVPDTNFQSVVSIPSVSFQRVLRCCDKRGDSVQICTRTQSPTDNYIIFSTDGDDANLRFHMKFRPESTDTWTDNSCLKMERYSLKYLLLITKATSLSNFVTLYLANDFVLAVRYSIGTIGEITFCLAPLVDKSTTIPPLVVPVRDIFTSSTDDAKQETPELDNNTEPVSGDTAPPVAAVEHDVTPQRVMKLVDSGEVPKRKRRRRKITEKPASKAQQSLLYSGVHMRNATGKTVAEALAVTDVEDALTMPTPSHTGRR